MKWYVYLICFALILGGGFCGFRLYELITAQSYIHGSIDIENKFVVESFSYRNNSLTFYHDLYDKTQTYSYEVELKPVADFNGVEKKYVIVLNDYVLFDTEINAGSVFATVYLDFYDTDGTLKCSSSMTISIKFLSNRTHLLFETTGSENASFLTQYFADYGIRLKINEIKGVQNEQDSN